MCFKLSHTVGNEPRFGIAALAALLDISPISMRVGSPYYAVRRCLITHYHIFCPCPDQVRSNTRQWDFLALSDTNSLRLCHIRQNRVRFPLSLLATSHIHCSSTTGTIRAAKRKPTQFQKAEESESAGTCCPGERAEPVVKTISVRRGWWRELVFTSVLTLIKRFCLSGAFLD